MSHSIKRGFARKINDPEIAIKNLNKQHKEIEAFLNSDKAFVNRVVYYAKDAKFQEWAVEPREIVPAPLVNNNMLSSTFLPGGPQQPPTFPQVGKDHSVQGAYPAAIVISIALVMLTYLTYMRLFTAQLAALFGLVALGLFFAFVFGGAVAGLLARLGQALLNRESSSEKKKTVGDLFDDAHKIYNRAYYGDKSQKSEQVGDIWDDVLVQQRKELVGIYWKIKALSESEWYSRKLLNDAYTIQMSNGAAANGQSSDFTG